MDKHVWLFNYELGNLEYRSVRFENDEKNEELYKRYKALAAEENKVIFDGCLSGYKYYDMDAVIVIASDRAKQELK